MHTQLWQVRLMTCLLTLLSGLLGLPSYSPAHVTEFTCPAGDVVCLIDAINQANANGESNTITLAAGTYTLTAVHNTTDGFNGLPSAMGVVTIHGAGADTTILERDTSAPRFRLVHVAATGTLTLEGLTLRQGNVQPSRSGGGIFNAGTLTLTDCTLLNNVAERGGGLSNEGGLVTMARSIIMGNFAVHPGGGILVFGGVVTIRQSTLAGNFADGGGGLANAGGMVIITESAIVDNQSLVQSGGGLVNGSGVPSSSVLVVTNTTIARNRVRSGLSFSGGGLTSFEGTVILTNGTVTGNDGDNFGGVVSTGGVLALQNTLVALNTGRVASDCGGSVTSLGHNLLGDPSGCGTLQPTDLTGDPGLGDFTDDGTPANGHFPLLPGSPAINVGNDAFCPPTDQLGQPRVGRCDIGAIEFQKKHRHGH